MGALDLTGSSHILKRKKRLSLVSGQHPRMVPQGGLFPGAFVSTAGAAPVIPISRGDTTVPALLREAQSVIVVSLGLGALRAYSNTPRSAGKKASEEVSNRLLMRANRKTKESGGQASQGCVFAMPVGEAAESRC